MVRAGKEIASVLLVFVFGLGIVSCLPAHAAEPVGEVIKLRGAVVARHDGMPRQIDVGQPIYESDVIATSDRAKARIRFNDGTMLTLGSGSSFEVRTYLLEADRRSVELKPHSGIFRAVVAPFEGASSFNVELQFSVASVRSTEWLFEVSETGCAVLVREGHVAVMHKVPALASPVVLSEGEGTDVRPDGAPTAPKMWGQKRVDDFLARTSFE